MAKKKTKIKAVQKQSKSKKASPKKIVQSDENELIVTFPEVLPTLPAREML